MEYSFISGATGGIGKAFCMALAKKGSNLFITGRSNEKLENLKKELQTVNGNIDIKYFACDLKSEESREKMLLFIDNERLVFDKIILVAGVDTQKAFLSYTEDKVLFQLRVNVEATISLTHALLNRRAERLEIVAISSMSGQSPMPYFALYSASKAMLTNFFTALHYELKDDNAKVTVVLPGGVPTRPDIVEAIKEQGLWGRLSAKPASFVAEKSLKAVKKNRVKYIPGFFNKFLNFIMKLAPKKVVLKFIARRWKKISKDAF